MSRATKKYFFVYLGTAVLLLFYGCILYPLVGPGYAVSISLPDDMQLEAADIAFLNTVAVKEGFGARYVSAVSDKWKCMHHDRKLAGPEWQHLKEYKYIEIGYCYDFVQPSAADKSKIKEIHINIHNDWAGQKPAIKKEIDRLVDVFFQEFASRFGADNVKKSKSRTGPYGI